MRKISFLLFFILVFPQPIGHSIIEGMIPESNNITEPIHTISLENLEFGDIAQIIQKIGRASCRERV